MKIVLNAARVNQNWLFIIIYCFLIAGCSYPSQKDKEKLYDLNELFYDSYKFEFESDIYVKISLKKDSNDLGYRKLRRDAVEIERHFSSTDLDEGRRHSSYVYFNIFDSNGNFIFQFYYDSRLRHIKTTKERPYNGDNR